MDEKMIRTILVPLAPNMVSTVALDAALSLAKRMNSHIRVVFMRPDAASVLSHLPTRIATTVTREAVEREHATAAADQKAHFDAWVARHDIPVGPSDQRLDACFATWLEVAGEIEPILTHYGRVSDLIVLSRFGRDDLQAQRSFDTALFSTGRPTLLVPGKTPWDMIDHVLIAWNGSLEASHAVFGIMPLLHAAGRVSIFSAPTPENEQATGAELVEALSWQGISVHQAIRPKAASSIEAALLATAGNCGATMIVMGAFTHSRWRQAFLGGVTRYVLAEAAIPVVMSH
jgi:nucleotide-binding universal stress UspA family protein